MMQNIVIFFIFIFIFSVNSYASCRNVSNELSDGSYIKALERLISYDTKLWSLIPSLSPAEESWLDREIEASQDRRFRVYRTDEYARRAVARTLMERIKIQYNLLENHKSINPDTKNQLINWTVLSSHYMYTNYGTHIGQLHDNNVITIPGMARNEYATSPFVRSACILVASSILENVLLPKIKKSKIY